MATNYKVLGQSAPAATTNTNVYTVPASTQAVISTIFITNRGTTDGTFDIAIRPAGETLANKHYIAKNVLLFSESLTAITSGITLGATDVITVYASTANFSFNVSGSEITA